MFFQLSLEINYEKLQWIFFSLSFINFTEAYFIILVEFFNQIYVFIIIIYGIETSSPRRTYI